MSQSNSFKDQATDGKMSNTESPYSKSRINKYECLEHITPPFRYGLVSPGLFRGAYPTLRNFRFLK